MYVCCCCEFMPQSWEKSASHTLVCTFVFKIYSLCTNVSRHCCESDYRERLLALRSLLLAANDGPLVSGGWGDSFACHLIRWSPAISRQAESKQRHRLFCHRILFVSQLATVTFSVLVIERSACCTVRTVLAPKFSPYPPALEYLVWN